MAGALVASHQRMAATDWFLMRVVISQFSQIASLAHFHDPVVKRGLVVRGHSLERLHRAGVL